MTRRPNPRRTGPLTIEAIDTAMPLETRHAFEPGDPEIWGRKCRACGMLPTASRYHLGPLPAREIREALAAGATDAELAQRYGCSLSAISRIATGAVHRDAGGPIRDPRSREPMIHRTVTLSIELSNRVDRARGDEQFTEWMRQAAEERLAREQPRSTHENH